MRAHGRRARDCDASAFAVCSTSGDVLKEPHSADVDALRGMLVPIELTLREHPNDENGVTDAVDATPSAGATSSEPSEPERKFFGDKVSHWSDFDAPGTLTCAFSVESGDDTDRDVTAEAFFTCDVALARSRAQLTRGGVVARCETASTSLGSCGRRFEVTCAFDGIDTSACVAHDVINVGAFEVVVRSTDGTEAGRGALLARVERDETGKAKRLVQPYEASFDA